MIVTEQFPRVVYLKVVVLTLSAIFAGVLLAPPHLPPRKSRKLLKRHFRRKLGRRRMSSCLMRERGVPSDYKYSGSRDRAFDQFYTAVQSKLPYQVEMSPSSANIILEFAVTCAPPAGASLVSMNFILRIYGRKDGVTLWTFTEPVRESGLTLQKGRDEAFDLGLANLIDDAQRAAIPSAVGPAAVSAQ